MSKRIRVILANAPVNNGNRGCVALSITSLCILKRIFQEKGIDAQIFLPDSAIPKNGKHSYHVNDLENLDYDDYYLLNLILKQFEFLIF